MGFIGGIYLYDKSSMASHKKSQMAPQITWIRACIFALLAFVCLFSTVCFQMSPQIACLRGCKVTLIAFVWLFSTVFFQMSPQMACLRGCIITLVAFVWLFPTVYFHMKLQIAFVRGRVIKLFTFVHFCDIFSLCLGDFHILFFSQWPLLDTDANLRF